MKTREIQRHLRELYRLDVSPDLISAFNDAVLEEVMEWQNPPPLEVLTGISQMAGLRGQ